jgi:uncharacterized protein YktB (UPF0637 family)
VTVKELYRLSLNVRKHFRRLVAVPDYRSVCKSASYKRGWKIVNVYNISLFGTFTDLFSEVVPAMRVNNIPKTFIGKTPIRWSIFKDYTAFVVSFPETLDQLTNYYLSSTVEAFTRVYY